MPEKNSTKKFGEILLTSGLLTKENLDKALERQKASGKRLGELLVEMGFLTEEDIARTISIQLGIPCVDCSSAVVEPEAIEAVPEKLAEKYTVLPLSVEGKILTLVMADPLNFEAIKDIQFASGKNIRPAAGNSREIKKAIQRYYHISAPLQEIVDKMMHANVEVVIERADDSQDLREAARKGISPPLIRLVNSVLYHAVKNRASDIHVEPHENGVLVRERVDGLLRDVFRLPKWIQGSITSRIKITSKMDIAEKRVPQDGRMRIRLENKEIDLRVSTLPVHYGESIVLRVLDIQSAVHKLEDIGLSEGDSARFRGIIERPQGTVIVTGPTGSGKTSTLYSVIKYVKTEKINIISLEDPVEYDMAGINQVNINEKTGLTFAYGLRSVLRQDPDVIMVGEMRDGETAKIATQASLTGHLVLSTLHTNTAVSAITRLKNLGIQPYLIGSALNGIMSQRLVRRICGQCKELYSPTAEELLKIGLREGPVKMVFYKGKGCNACDRTGYRGRTGVFEILVLNSEIRELIANNAAEDAILKAAVSAGMRHLIEDGVEKARQGITSIEEILRVLSLREDEGVLICASCGGSIRSDFTTCPYCAAAVMNRCPSCGKAREHNWKFCPYCRVDFLTASPRGN